MLLVPLRLFPRKRGRLVHVSNPQCLISMPPPIDSSIPNLYAMSLLFHVITDGQPIIRIGCYISGTRRWRVVNATTLPNVDSNTSKCSGGGHVHTRSGKRLFHGWLGTARTRRKNASVCVADGTVHREPKVVPGSSFLKPTDVHETHQKKEKGGINNHLIKNATGLNFISLHSKHCNVMNEGGK